MPYRIPDPPLPVPPPPPGAPRGWWLHVLVVAAPVVAMAFLKDVETQIDLAVAWLVYNTLATALFVRWRREVDAWVLGHVGLVIVGLAAMGSLAQTPH